MQGIAIALLIVTRTAAAFDVTGRKASATPSVIFCFMCKTAGKKSSKFYSDLRNASSLELTKYYVNCRCSTVTMLIKLSSCDVSVAALSCNTHSQIPDKKPAVHIPGYRVVIGQDLKVVFLFFPSLFKGCQCTPSR